MRKTIATAILAISIAVSMGTVAAQDSSQDAEVNVSVTGTTQLDVRPTELDYSGLEPGDQASSTDEAQGYAAIEVENIGSNNISNIWAEASIPDANPFGTGTSDQYDAGNFIQLSTEQVIANESDYGGPNTFTESIQDGTATNYHYVNRIEYEDDPAPTYIDTWSTTSEANLQQTDTSGFSELGSHVGRFREGDEWYFYTIYFDDNGGTGECSSSSDGEVWVGNDPHTPTSLGTTDFTDQDNVDIYDIEDANGGGYGVTNSTVSYSVTNSTDGSETVDYGVYTYCAGDPSTLGHTYRTQFNTDPYINTSVGGNVNVDAAPAANDILAESGSNYFYPGDYFPIDVTVELPQGVVSEDINGGELSLLAQAQT